MLKRKKMNKKGGLAELFLFMIFSLIIIFISGIFIYVGLITQDALHDSLDNMDLSSNNNENLTNASEIIDDTFGEVNTAYASLYWIAILLIVGMVIAIFIGSYMSAEKPIFFFFYIFIFIIAIVVAVAIAFAYQEFRTQIEGETELSNVFDGLFMANEVMGYLPLWVAIIGIIGSIIVASRMGRGQDQFGGGGFYG